MCNESIMCNERNIETFSTACHYLGSLDRSCNHCNRSGCLAILPPRGEAGTIGLKAEADGLKSATMMIHSQ